MDQRLTTDNYIKHSISITDTKTKEEIKELLEDYEQISNDNLSNIPLGTHIRYFSKDKDGKYLFRMGGVLKNNKNCNQYIVLVNAHRKSWSVQTENTIFYAKKSIKKLKTEYESKIHEKDELIKQLIFMNKEMKRKLNNDSQI
jgi:hypothetical protein